VESETRNKIKKDQTLAASILLSAIILSGAWIYTTGQKIVERDQADIQAATGKEHTRLEE
jgi:hypothetical protein